MTPPPRFRSLSPVLRCPDRRCGRIVFANPEEWRGVMQCQACKGSFWATRLHAGSIRAQLVEDYDGDEAIADRMMALFDLPAAIEQPMYWHIWLTAKERHEYNTDPEPGRSRNLFRRILDGLHRRAS